MAVGSRHRATVGEVERAYSSEVRALIRELAAAAARARQGVSFPPGLEERLCAYARSVGHFPTALKEVEWRNGWFVDLTLQALSELKQDPCPLHTDLILNDPQQKKLFFAAKQRWLERKKAKAATYYRQEEEQIRLRNWRGRSAGEDLGVITGSPTVARFRSRGISGDQL
jgi:hypothetical protein